MVLASIPSLSTPGTGNMELYQNTQLYKVNPEDKLKTTERIQKEERFQNRRQGKWDKNDKEMWTHCTVSSGV